jgi:hypothetical protein
VSYACHNISHGGQIIMRAGFFILHSFFGGTAALVLAAWLALCSCLGPSIVRAEPLSAPPDRAQAPAETDHCGR